VGIVLDPENRTAGDAKAFTNHLNLQALGQ
jgi:hypothetical protein